MADRTNEPTPSIPRGYGISPMRETSQLVPGSGVQQGMVYEVRHPNGAQSTVFIPYNRMADEAWVKGAIARHIAQVSVPEQMSTDR